LATRGQSLYYTGGQQRDKLGRLPTPFQIELPAKVDEFLLAWYDGAAEPD
jgi:hypothetical protein